MAQPDRDFDAIAPDSPAGLGSEAVAFRPYDPARDREWVRGLIAALMTGVFCAVILVLAVEALRGSNIDDLAKLSAVILTPVSGLLGAVVGFYYGEQSHR